MNKYSEVSIILIISLITIRFNSLLTATYYNVNLFYIYNLKRFLYMHLFICTLHSVFINTIFQLFAQSNVIKKIYNSFTKIRRKLFYEGNLTFCSN